MNWALISIAQLVKQLNFIVTIFDKLCVIQDRLSRTLIGVGEQCEGVYLFLAVRIKQANKVKGAEARDLWHQRLGHPLNHISKFIPKV